MIITRTPFRVTLGGGGTDLPAYYEKYGGFVFSAGIDKYMFISVNRPIVDDLVRLKYSKTEIVEHIDQLQHEIAREALRMIGIERAIEVDSLADVPAGTGLGSSSCYAVGLLHALHTLQRDHISLQELAEEACRLEIEILGKPIGKQDQYMAAFGGLTVLEIDKDGKVAVRQANMTDEAKETLNRNMMMFYMKSSRDANEILAEQTKGAKEEKKDVIESMHYIKDIGRKILESAENGKIDDIGWLFDEHWQYKKKMSAKISNPRFDEIYEEAKVAGALGGKISGAGGGGFFTVYVPQNHAQFRRRMEALGLREMKYRFDFEGSKVLVNF